MRVLLAPLTLLSCCTVLVAYMHIWPSFEQSKFDYQNNQKGYCTLLIVPQRSLSSLRYSLAVAAALSQQRCLLWNACIGSGRRTSSRKCAGHHPCCRALVVAVRCAVDQQCNRAAIAGRLGPAKIDSIQPSMDQRASLCQKSKNLASFSSSCSLLVAQLTCPTQRPWVLGFNPRAWGSKPVSVRSQPRPSWPAGLTHEPFSGAARAPAMLLAGLWELYMMVREIRNADTTPPTPLGTHMKGSDTATP